MAERHRRLIHINFIWSVGTVFKVNRIDREVLEVKFLDAVNAVGDDPFLVE